MLTLRLTQAFQDWLDAWETCERRFELQRRDNRHARRRGQVDAEARHRAGPAHRPRTGVGIMTRPKTKTSARLLPFDAARYLTDDAAIAEYMTAVLETGDSDLLLMALGDVPRARAMAQVAKERRPRPRELLQGSLPGPSPASTWCSRSRARSE